MRAPLYRDPVHDGATDPTLIWNRSAGEWWMVYTSRRAAAEGPGVAWVHGSDLGVAASRDGGATWVYRGLLPGLDFEWGRNTFWAPEIIWHEGLYHMFVTYIQGVPDRWEGNDRRILHYTSTDLLSWAYESKLALSSNRVIDACVFRLPSGSFRMWYKDEAAGSLTFAADSPNLYDWEVVGPVLTHQPHEGPNVFEFKGYYWMVIDEWQGQGVYRSGDLESWERNGRILDAPGCRAEDGTIGLHADVVVQENMAYIFYFTHPERIGNWEEESLPGTRRSSIQVARLDVVDGRLICPRDEAFELNLLTE